MSAHEDLILIRDEQWFRLTAQGFTEITSWSKLDHPARVVLDGDMLVMGVERLEGKAAHAVPRIEKRLRHEGLVEGAAHVRVEAHQDVPNGVQAFYGAAPLEFWQRLTKWSVDQGDHCQILPLSSLLPGGAGKERACVVHSGRRLHFFAHGKGGPAYFSVAAIGNGEEELFSALRMLVERCRIELARGVTAPLTWYALTEIDARLLTRLIEQFARQAGIAVVPANSSVLQQGMVTALPSLVDKAGLGAGSMTGLARLAWVMERSGLAIASGVALIAIGLAALGGVTQMLAQQEKNHGKAQSANIAALEERIRKAAAIDLPAEAESTGAFARQMAAGTVFDPVRMLILLRAASGSEVRILRLRLEVSGDKSKSFRFDGMANGTDPIGRLLAHLRSAGWEAQPLEPVDPSPGAFSYRLMPSGSLKQGKTT